MGPSAPDISALPPVDVSPRVGGGESGCDRAPADGVGPDVATGGGGGVPLFLEKMGQTIIAVTTISNNNNRITNNQGKPPQLDFSVGLPEVSSSGAFV